MKQRTIRFGALLLLAASIALLMLATWMTMVRNRGYDISYVAPSEVYVMKENSYLVSVDSESRSEARITVADQQHLNWRHDASSEPTQHQTRSSGRFSISEGIGSVEVELIPSGKSVELSYGDFPNADIPSVSSVSLPLATSVRYSIRDFAAPPSEWPENEVRQAEEILASLGLIDSMTARDKILRIAAHLHNELDQHRGSPEPFMRRSSAWQQYVSAIGGRSRVYCSNFAEIFAFFASVAGVPTRLVDVRGHLADVPLAAHAFNEAYDSDSNQWMYVDLQLSVGAILTASGRALNGVDILLRRQASNQHDLIVKGLARGKISNEPISEFSEMVNFFIPSEATLVYLWASANRFSVADRALRLMIYPQPAVSIRQSRPNSTLRLLPSYIGAVGFVFSVCILLYLRGKRRRPL